MFHFNKKIPKNFSILYHRIINFFIRKKKCVRTFFIYFIRIKNFDKQTIDLIKFDVKIDMLDLNNVNSQIRIFTNDASSIFVRKLSQGS